MARRTDRHVKRVDLLGMLAHVIATDDLIANDRIESAVLEIHERADVIAVRFELLQATGELGIGREIIFRRRRRLRADSQIREARLFGDRARLFAVANEDDLPIIHVRIGEEHVFLAFGSDVETIPENVDAFRLELGLFARPIDALELDRTTETTRRLFREIDIEADDLIVLVLEAHRRIFVIESDDDRLRLVIRFRSVRCRLISAAATGKHRAGSQHRSHEQFLEFHQMISPRKNIGVKTR